MAWGIAPCGTLPGHDGECWYAPSPRPLPHAGEGAANAGVILSPLWGEARRIRRGVRGRRAAEPPQSFVNWNGASTVNSARNQRLAC